MARGHWQLCMVSLRRHRHVEMRHSKVGSDTNRFFQRRVFAWNKSVVVVEVLRNEYVGSAPRVSDGKCATWTTKGLLGTGTRLAQ